MKWRAQLPLDYRHIFEKLPNFKNKCVYKFVTSEIANLILNHGSVRIGTLRSFREMESSLTSDQSEGLEEETSPQAGFLLSEIQDDSIAAKMIGLRNLKRDGRLPPNFDIQFEDVSFVDDMDFPLICFSYENSTTTRSRLCDEYNRYDCCLRVLNIDNLCEDICEIINNSHPTERSGFIKFLRLPVIYRKPVRTPIDVRLPAPIQIFYKDPFYADDRECRAVFFSSMNEGEFSFLSDGEKCEHKVVQDGRLAKHFELVERF